MQAGHEFRIVWCTFPDLETARQIGTTLVENQLAACVNLCPHLESIYRWQGAVETSPEVLAILKTTATALPTLERELRRLHPYEVPEIVTLQPEEVAETYAAWWLQSVNPLASQHGGE
ncbi:MAG: divalent-cation tolerance protein CutA [Verrucomicrobiales bacterium]|nr:divalent-cation tolerance protein CutA [Verrucomicrobiales bacterium]